MDNLARLWTHPRTIVTSSLIFMISLIAIFLGYGEVSAAYLVDLDMVETGQTTPVDTIFVGPNYDVRYFIENDTKLAGISLGFLYWSNDGVTWTWTDPNLAVEVVGSRMHPSSASVWDMTGFLINAADSNGVSPDSLLLGGVAITGGIIPGGLEHMITMGLNFAGITGDEIRTFCIDSSFIPPYGDFVFSFPGGTGTVPNVIWPAGGKCWPVMKIPNDCPAWDGSLPESLVVNHCFSETVTLSATDPESDPISFSLGSLNGGVGLVTLDDHGDGTVDVTYEPDPSDVGQAITIDLDLSDPAHPAGVCDSYSLTVAVINNSPQIDCGMPSYLVHAGNDVVKTDIAETDDDTCDVLEYLLISGSGSIDAITGVYSWLGVTSFGIWPITVAITDSHDTTNCTFGVEVIGAVADTCDVAVQFPGDVNSDGSININDIGYLNSFLDLGGSQPPILANADVNGDYFIDEADLIYITNSILNAGPAPVDCTCLNPAVCDCYIGDANEDGSLNVGDAVYLINFVFKQGPAPAPYPTCNGDANSDCVANVGDAVFMINFVFKHGPRPAFCHDWINSDTGCGWIER